MWKSSLTPDEAIAVDALVARAAAVDGTPALNEDARLARDDGSYRHLLHQQDGELTGYLTHSTGYGTSQLVVDPAHRRRGIGSLLVGQLTGLATPRLWAFGDGPAARAFVGALGLVPGRGLLIMARDLTAADTAPAPADGLTLRGYASADADQLLAVNAAAFAHHPEQGALDLAGLRARMAEPWFDPSGLVEAFEGDTLLGFHWTKRHDATTGEVYVLAVHPRAQGRGLGRRLLRAGLARLREGGCSRVILYVDRADTVAVGLYESAGFTVIHRDVLYVPQREQEGA